jgi:hypothetical protein
MAAMMSTASMVVVAPNAAQLASGSSVAFNNGGVRTNLVMSRRSARPLTVRVMADDRNLGDKLKAAVSGAKDSTLSKVEDIKSSTGELNPAKAKAAEEDNPDGTSIIDKLTDAGRTLKSKTNDVVEYGVKRNSPDVADNVTEKNIKEQSEYTKGL